MKDFSVGIFIRSYDKDAEFLQLCLTSWKQNGQSYDDIVIVGDGVTDIKVRQIADDFGVKYHKDDSAQISSGYIAQQYSKFNAHKYLDTDYIIFVDSDCVFRRDHDIEEWFDGSKPVLLYDEWDDTGDAKKAWFDVCCIFVGDILQHEYMRRLPLIYPRKVLVDISSRLGGNLLERMKRTRNVSEFNVIGYYCYTFHYDKFAWHKGKSYKQNPPIVQYWSHGDFDKAKEEYET